MSSNESIEIVLVFAADGQAQAGIPSGTTFERAGPALKRFFAALGIDGLPIVMLGEPESHREGDQRLHVHAPGINAHAH